MEKYSALGIMSGTSLDGLDLALCHFWEDNQWHYSIVKARTVKYPAQLKSRLRKAQHLSGLDLIALHKEYGRFIVQQVNAFLDGMEKPLLIASHGHTVFHYPDGGINLQIGDGAVIAALTGLPVVCDFRSTDIALGGQGAPLVPTGDYFLFPGYAMLLNLGGFSNITIRNPLTAFDICPVNFALNYFARQFAMEYDRDGHLGRQGQVNPQLLAELDNLPYYSQTPPKSLSDHWFYDNFLAVVEKYKISPIDKLATIYHHIARQITNITNQHQGNILITGGGARNKFLIELIRQNSANPVVIPDDETVDFKEAVVFAFLGLLRWLGRTNVFRAVTGASRDTISGAVYLP